MKRKLSLKKILKEPFYWYEKYHTRSKLSKETIIVDEDKWPDQWKTIFYKSYARMEHIALPKPRNSTIPLKNILVKRTSSRDFSSKKIFLSELSTLLYYSAGIKDTQTMKRFYPSAGQRYPLEIYIISINSALPKGIYHYYSKDHSLEKLSILEVTLSELFTQDWIATSSVIITISAVFQRSVIKYGERGYKFCLLEAGHLAQNFYLNATAQDLACCSIGGYYETLLEDLLNIDGSSESILTSIAIGKK